MIRKQGVKWCKDLVHLNGQGSEKKTWKQSYPKRRADLFVVNLYKRILLDNKNYV